MRAGSVIPVDTCRRASGSLVSATSARRTPGAIALLPYSDPGEVELMLQDNDFVVKSERKYRGAKR